MINVESDKQYIKLNLIALSHPTNYSIPKSGISTRSSETDCIDGCTKVLGGREKVSLHFSHSYRN